MKVVVTGATGHLGCYVVDELLERGHEVIATSRSGDIPEPTFGRGPPSATARGLKLDLVLEDAVEILARELGPQVTLVHLAAWAPEQTARTGAAERRQLLATNVHGTMRLLDAARSAGARAVIYASSFEVYGDIRDFPILETSRVQPLTDYGASKLAGEDHLFAFAEEQHVRAVALRFPAIYGPGERTPRALPNFLRAVLDGQAPEIQGDGADLRDQLHVRDAALSCVLAVEKSTDGAFNVADGEAHSIAELAGIALELANLPAPARSVPRVKPRRDYHMSIERASTLLGFAPRVRLREGMAEELTWLRSLSAAEYGPSHELPSD
jgi:UDP-glucose 4-epimerase